MLKINWLVVNNGVAAPTTTAEILAKKNAFKSGTVNLLANTETAAKISALVTNSEYDFYAYGEDIYGNNTEITSKIDIKTKDISAPVFSTSYPKLGVVTNHTLQLLAKTDEAATFYWMILAKGSLVPTVVDLQEGIDGVPQGTFTAAARTEASVSVSGLAETTEYDAYILAVDAAGNQAKVVKLTAKTSDVTAPSYLASFPYISLTTAAGISIMAQTDEPCKLYWAVVDLGTAPPADGITLTRGYPAVKSGILTLTLGKAGTLAISGLKAASNYVVYFSAIDAANNASPLKNFTFRTVDTLAPTATLTYSDDIGGLPTYNADLQISFNEIVRKALDDTELTPASVTALIKLIDHQSTIYALGRHPAAGRFKNQDDGDGHQHR